MARVVEPAELHRPHVSHSVYPWEKWQDGQVWQLKRGRDFDVEFKSMRTQLLVRARYIKRKVTTRVHKEDSTLTFTFQRKDETVEQFEERTRNPSWATE
jgi:hypothetical protein